MVTYAACVLLLCRGPMASGLVVRASDWFFSEGHGLISQMVSEFFCGLIFLSRHHCHEQSSLTLQIHNTPGAMCCMSEFTAITSWLFSPQSSQPGCRRTGKTVVMGSGYGRFESVLKINCMRQSKRQLASSSYNHNTLTTPRTSANSTNTAKTVHCRKYLDKTTQGMVSEDSVFYYMSEVKASLKPQ